MVNFGYLFAEVAGAGVDYEVNVVGIVFVKLDEMVAATKRADSLMNSAAIL